MMKAVGLPPLVVRSMTDSLRQSDGVRVVRDFALEDGSVVTFRSSSWVTKTIDEFSRRQESANGRVLIWERICDASGRVDGGMPRIFALLKIPYELNFLPLASALEWWGDQIADQGTPEKLSADFAEKYLSRHLDVQWHDLPSRIKIVAFLSVFLSPADPVSMVFVPGQSLTEVDWQFVEQAVAYMAKSTGARVILIREDRQPTQFREFIFELRAQPKKPRKSSRYGEERDGEIEDEFGT